MKLLHASFALGLFILAHTVSAENDLEEAKNNEPETVAQIDGSTRFISDNIDAAEGSPAENDGAVRTLHEGEGDDRDKFFGD